MDEERWWAAVRHGVAGADDVVLQLAGIDIKGARTGLPCSTSNFHLNRLQWLSPLQTSARCVPRTSPRHSHPTFSLSPPDHVRPTVGIMDQSHSFPASPSFSLPSVFFSREDVVLTSGSTSSWYAVSQSPPCTSADVALSDHFGLYVCLFSGLITTLSSPQLPRQAPESFTVRKSASSLTEADADPLSFISALYNPQVLASSRRRHRFLSRPLAMQ